MLCPKCGKKIHALKKSHSCGWRKEESTFPPTLNNDEVQLVDVLEVSRLMKKMGPQKFKELAAIF